MLRTASGILSEIVQRKKEEVAELHSRAAILEREARDRRSHPRSFADALRSAHPAIIAEMKKSRIAPELRRKDALQQAKVSTGSNQTRPHG